MGVPAGAIMGAVMMAVRAIAPKWADDIVKAADAVAKGFGESRFIKAVKILFGKAD